MIPGPSVDLGPLGALGFYSLVALVAAVLIVAVATGGMFVFAVAGVLIVAGVYLLMRRVMIRLTGRRTS